MGEASHVEARPPMAVTVLAEVEVVADAMQPHGQESDATPAVPAVNEV